MTHVFLCWENQEIWCFSIMTLKSCNIALFISSLALFCVYLKTGIIVFIRFDKSLHLKLSYRYQLKVYNKGNKIALSHDDFTICLMVYSRKHKTNNAGSFCLNNYHIHNIYWTMDFKIEFNFSTSIMLRRYKRKIGPLIFFINQRTHRLTQICKICFAEIKIPYIFSVKIWVIADK